VRPQKSELNDADQATALWQSVPGAFDAPASKNNPMKSRPIDPEQNHPCRDFVRSAVINIFGGRSDDGTVVFLV
jgi:hypothetical protein